MTSPAPEQPPLGRTSTCTDHCDASLLLPLPRAPKRARIGLAGETPFFGADLWTAYELSWLNLRGKPQVALAHFMLPCETLNLVESKSLKLYLNSFNNSHFADATTVQARLRADLSEAVWRGADQPATVGVRLVLPEAFEREQLHSLEGLSLDRLDIECTENQPAPELLRTAIGEAPVSEVLTSDLLKSNGLDTSQPGWGSVRIAYSGPQIDQERLLQYLVSLRDHSEFQEQCVERIFMDLWTRCQPIKLEVYARFTRCGSVDINPWRTSHPMALPKSVRTARQ